MSDCQRCAGEGCRWCGHQGNASTHAALADRKQHDMDRATDKADRDHAGEWSNTAKQFLWRYIREITGETPFFVVQAREWAEANGCPLPHSKRAWGNIVSAARRAGVLEPVGIEMVDYKTSPHTNACPATKWRWTGLIVKREFS